MKNAFLLASQSPRRKKILEFWGYSFRVVPPRGVVENLVKGEAPPAMVRRLALKKALQVSGENPGSPVLAADTVVAVGGRIFGKPGNRREAFRILKALQGRSHEVWTGVALAGWGKKPPLVYAEKSLIRFKPFPWEGLGSYLGTREPYDKAGAYDIRGTARRWVLGWEGSYFNIMGLPVEWFHATLARGPFSRGNRKSVSRSGRF